MGAAADELLDDEERNMLREHRARKAEKAERKAKEDAESERRAESGRKGAVALGYAAKILTGRKKPSRDESTWGDRTGKEDEEYEREQKYKDSVKSHKTKAGFIGVRG